MKTQEDGYYIDMSKATAIKLLKILRDLVFCFVVCVLLGAINSWLDEQFFWIFTPIFSVVSAVSIAIGRMKIGKGERATYPLEDQMIDYYLKDKNFVTLTLKVCDVEFKDGKNQLLLTFEIEETIDIEYRLEGEKTFVLVYQDRYNLDINNGDVLTFTTAPQKYYNRHTLPILSLHKDNEEIVSIKEGTNNYISWISDNIK